VDLLHDTDDRGDLSHADAAHTLDLRAAIAQLFEALQQRRLVQAVFLSGIDQHFEGDRTAELGVHELGCDANRIVLWEPADRVIAEGEPRDSHDGEEHDGGHAREHRLRIPDTLFSRPQQHALDPMGSPDFAWSEAPQRNRVEQGR